MTKWRSPRYKLVVVADLDDLGVVNNDTHAKWGPLAFQKVKGERKLMDGDALFDLGCTLTAITFQSPLRETMTMNLELIALERDTPSYTARLYSSSPNRAATRSSMASNGSARTVSPASATRSAR